MLSGHSNESASPAETENIQCQTKYQNKITLAAFTRWLPRRNQMLVLIAYRTITFKGQTRLPIMGDISITRKRAIFTETFRSIHKYKDTYNYVSADSVRHTTRPCRRLFFYPDLRRLVNLRSDWSTNCILSSRIEKNIWFVSNMKPFIQLSIVVIRVRRTL